LGLDTGRSYRKGHSIISTSMYPYPIYPEPAGEEDRPVLPYAPH